MAVQDSSFFQQVSVTFFNSEWKVSSPRELQGGQEETLLDIFNIQSQFTLQQGVGEITTGAYSSTYTICVFIIS